MRSTLFCLHRKPQISGPSIAWLTHFSSLNRTIIDFLFCQLNHFAYEPLYLYIASIICNDILKFALHVIRLHLDVYRLTFYIKHLSKAGSLCNNRISDQSD